MIFLKYVDVFDENFHFYTGNQPSNHSIFGGIMTLSFIILSIGAFIIFEYDELFQLNPISSKSEMNYGYDDSIEKLEEDKIWIPWRLAKYGNKFIDHRGILYPIIYSVKGIKNKENKMDLEYRKLKYKLCNETSMANKTKNYIIDVNINELFCIDDELGIIRGSWDKKEIDYIEINLYLCQDGINFNISNPKCKTVDSLLTFYNTSLLFQFYYPVIQFQPTDKKIPMFVSYKSYYYRLSSYANQIERLYLKKNILADDQNIFGNNPINYTFWGMSDLYGDSYFSPDEPEKLVEGSSSRLYSLIIYKDQGLIFYTRSYKKILNIISDIFPILNFIFIIFKKITGKIKSSYLKRSLMELLFEINNQKNELILNKEVNINNIIQPTVVKINSLPNKDSFKKQKLNFNHLLKRKSNDFINSIKDEMINDKSSQLIHLNKVNNDISGSIDLNEILNKKNKNKTKHQIKYPITKQHCDKEFNISKSMNVKKVKILNSSEVKYKDSRKKLFPIYYYFMDVFLDIITQPKKFWIVSQQYLIVYNFMSQLYDISTYVLLYEKFNIIRRVLYFKNYAYFSQTKKINILNEEVMININENLRNKKNAIFSDDLLIHC